MRQFISFLLVTLLFAAAPGNLHAYDEAQLYLCENGCSQGPYLTGQTIPLGDGRQYFIAWFDVIAFGWRTPLSSVRFALPTSDCMTVETFDVWSQYTMVGDPASGVTIEFGECFEDFTVIASVYTIFIMSADSCCALTFEPHTEAISLRVDGVDCKGDTVRVVPNGGTFNFRWGVYSPGCCGCPTTPKFPWPADGTIDQPHTVELDWFTQTTAGTNLGVFQHKIYFGTTPDPPLYRTQDGETWSTVGPLEPNTTYYWRIRSVATDFSGARGPVWSFTTAPAVPIEKTSWGKIKAMMRKRD